MANALSSSPPKDRPMEVDVPATPPQHRGLKRTAAKYLSLDTDGSPVRQRLAKRIKGSPDAGMHVDAVTRSVFGSPQAHPSPMRAPLSSPFDQLVHSCRFRMQLVSDPTMLTQLQGRLSDILNLPKDVGSQELSLLLYYLEKPQENHPALLNRSAPLFDQRVLEILENIESAKTEAKVEDCAPLPPCVKQLILRALVRTCILPTGKFMPEGAAVVVRMLHTPIGGALEIEQYRTELVHIFTQIRDNPSLYQPIFEEARNCDTSRLPPLVKQLIKLDWQLEGEEISSAQFCWSLLKALLEPNQQLMHHSNCYAVAALNYASIAVPHKFLETLLQLAVTGKVNCGSDELPIMIPREYLRDKDVLNGLDESDDPTDTAQRVTALLNNMLRFYLVHGAMVGFLNAPEQRYKKAWILDNILSLATSHFSMRTNPQLCNEFCQQVKARTAIAEFVSLDESHQTHIGLLKQEASGEWTAIPTVNALQVHLSSCTSYPDLQRWIHGTWMKDLLIQNIRSVDIKEAAVLRREARLTGTLGFPTLGGGGDKVLEQLFGIHCQKSFISSNTPRELIEQLHQFSQPTQFAVMTNHNHDFLFDGRILRSLSKDEMHGYLDEQPQRRPFTETVRALAPIEWRQILNKLRLNLNCQEIHRQMKFQGERHPFHIASLFHNSLKMMGDYRFSLFQVYCAIAKQTGHQVAIPFANHNTHLGDNPEALGYDQLAVAFCHQTMEYQIVFLNERGPCRSKEMDWTKTALFYS